MNFYALGASTAFEKLGMSMGEVLRAAALETEAGGLRALLAKMAPHEVEALRSYITSIGEGGVRADIWKTQPELAQRLEAALKNIAPPSDFDRIYTQWRAQNPSHPASREDVRAAYDRYQAGERAGASPRAQSARQRADERWSRNSGDTYTDTRDRAHPLDLHGAIPAITGTALFTGLVGGPPAAFSGYGGKPSPWNVGRVVGHGMLGGLGGGLAGGALGTLATVATKGRAAIPLILGGTAAGTLAGSYVGGRTQRPWYNE